MYQFGCLRLSSLRAQNFTRLSRMEVHQCIYIQTEEFIFIIRVHTGARNAEDTC